MLQMPTGHSAPAEGLSENTGTETKGNTLGLPDFHNEKVEVFSIA
jgi:hypothetical protein